MKLIGLTGPAGAGKDTVAAHLCREHGFISYAFAKPIKDMLRVIGVDCDSRENKEKPHPVFDKSPRVMAQTLGTEWMRDLICENGWLLVMENRLQDIRHWEWRCQNEPENTNLPPAPTGVVITDVRFQNEAAFIQHQGGVIWHIERSNVVAVAPHTSESGVPILAGDLVLANSGTIAELHRLVDIAIENPGLLTYAEGAA